MSDIQLTFEGATALVQLKGAQLASYKTPEGREVIWQGDAWPQHSPVLFPVCGTVNNETIRIAGKPYHMTKHGFTRDPDFTPIKIGDDFVELALGPTEESKPMYPFDFAFHVTHTLKNRGFVTTFTVENKSDRVMPFCVGGHPAFACPMEDGARFEDYDLIFPCPEDGINALVPGGGCINGTEILPTLRDEGVIHLAHDLFDTRDALVLTTVKSRSVKLVHRVSGKGLQFDFPKMEVLAVWSMPGANADYVCLEPWHGMPDTADASGNFEDKPFVTLLNPGRAWQASFTVTLI